MSDIVRDLKTYSRGLRGDGPLNGLLQRAIDELKCLRSFTGVAEIMETDMRAITKGVSQSNEVAQ